MFRQQALQFTEGVTKDLLKQPNHLSIPIYRYREVQMNYTIITLHSMRSEGSYHYTNIKTVDRTGQNSI